MQPMNRPPHRGHGRRDPAPSRFNYRLQRMMLTPIYRRLFRVGLPILLVTLVVGIYFASESRRAGVAQSYVALKEAFQGRPEFQVHLFRVENASPQLAETIRRLLDLQLPESSFDLDLVALRERILTLDPVADVALRIAPGGVLTADVDERVPVVVWRSAANVELLDAEGNRVMLVAERNDRADLPLIAGTGANKAVPEVMALIAAAEPIMPRVRGIVRVGERRWDFVLDRNQRILLPVDDPIPAIERILALDQADDLLARDVIAIDFRLKERPVLRLAPNAMAELRRARANP
ncbi:cell division protein FtsQ/DivIB [Falsirhodobacter halotolerans]|uniref:cell division protein FtsQ/DivIB n=1 Tax=Falsirhodobacter halotolerans TaxID=1146892 RepID=UPI001FCFFC64|nr:cell division protein FtsQ/DivIB [Falsirhodobacter halotolerans]MCJ8140300.1 cell division protein FtsQ/DivIB [Falsirhodobacter halotolerans]